MLYRQRNCEPSVRVLLRRAMAVRSRDARQRSIIATRAMANREMRKCKSERDRAFAELVYRNIFMRTGGLVRSWTVIIANVNRLKFLVSSIFTHFATTLFSPRQRSDS